VLLVNNYVWFNIMYYFKVWLYVQTIIETSEYKSFRTEEKETILQIDHFKNFFIYDCVSLSVVKYHLVSLSFLKFVGCLSPTEKIEMLSIILVIIRYRKCLKKHLDNGDILILLFFSITTPVSGIMSYNIKQYHLKN
jgi:hypothetical protein